MAAPAGGRFGEADPAVGCELVQPDADGSGGGSGEQAQRVQDAAGAGSGAGVPPPGGQGKSGLSSWKTRM